jgi:hypothetical protein
MSDETAPSPEALLYGEVTTEAIAALRFGKLPNLPELKARFPAVADRLDRFVPELLVDVRAFQRLTRREVVRALEGILAALKAGAPLEATGPGSLQPWVPERLQAAIETLAAEAGRVLWLPKELWAPDET